MHQRLHRGEDVLFEEALPDKSFQVCTEALVVNSLMSVTVVIRTILFYSGECRVILDRPRMRHLRLVFDGIKDFIDGEPQRSEALFHFEGVRWIWREDCKRLSFLGWLLPVLVTGIGWSFMPRL